MGYTTIKAVRYGAVLHVELHRPEQLNAFDATMIDELVALWQATATDRTIRAVVLTGSGRGFCAGSDVGALAAPRQPRGAGVEGELAFLPGRQLDVPVIVAVNGVCAGGGLHFVADGDIVIASEDATFVDPHVSVGQVSGLEPVSLALRVPIPRLLRLCLLGSHERLTASQALDIDLVTEVVPAGKLSTRAAEIAELVAANSPAAVAATRRIVRELETRLLGKMMDEAWEGVQQHWKHPDSREGPEAFGAKREPRWWSGTGG